MNKSKMYPTKGLACNGPGEAFKKSIINRNALGDNDVEIDIKFCGISHDDVHAVNNDVGNTVYPLIPGHEIAGVVTEVGDNVEEFDVDDPVGVGAIIETCLPSCTFCNNGDQQCCPQKTMTYGDVIKHGLVATNTGKTYGGYSKKITVNEKYVTKLPGSLPLENAAPLMCAGVSAFSALKRFGADSGGKKVGVVGIGGLGMIAIKLAAKMGNEVTAISTSPEKEAKCKKFGAAQFLLSSDITSDGSGSLDLILDTMSVPHQCSVFLPLLGYNGTLVNLGTNLQPQTTDVAYLMEKRIAVAGSRFGGLAETKECIKFCKSKKIVPEVEVVAGVERINEVYQMLTAKNGEAKRYVIDVANTF